VYAKCTPVNAYVSMRQHASAYVSIRQRICEVHACECIRQHALAYVSICQRICEVHACECIRYVSAYAKCTPVNAYVSMRQHTSQHTSAYVSGMRGRRVCQVHTGVYFDTKGR
jgi:hypothetical protein